jgi:protein-S-isoprenylcysteine O-methyltransferase Ste14
MDVGPKYEKEKAQKAIQFFAQFAFIAMFIVPALDHRFHWSHINLALSLVADVFVAFGFYIVFMTFKENTYTSAIIEVQIDQRVISTGPYSFVRHPMYSGALLMLIATPIALGSLWGLFAFIPMLIVIITRLVKEEKYLKENLLGYSDYCKKVRWHLLPGIY